MARYLLDTNIASHIIKGDLPSVRQRLAACPIDDVSISVVTEAELRYGVAKRGYPAGLKQRVHEFLIRVDILPWTSEVAGTYADLRAQNESVGITLAPLDLMIAAHAIADGLILVTRDRAFSRVPVKLSVEDWCS